jgi:hypothetical protein
VHEVCLAIIILEKSLVTEEKKVKRGREGGREGEPKRDVNGEFNG